MIISSVGAGMIMRMMRLPDGRLKVLVQGLSKVRVTEYRRTEPYIEVQVETLDERWTTLEAERALRESSSGRGRSRRREQKRRERVDATAAAIILRTYLARLNAPDNENGGHGRAGEAEGRS